MLAKKNSNRQEAKELTQLINNLKNSSLRIDPELNQLETEHAKLEKKLEPLSKVREGRAIRSSLENIPGSAEEDRQQIAEIDAIRLEVLKAIQDVLDL